MAAYQAALDTALDRPSRHPAGSVGEMIVRYYTSVEFTDGLKPSSKALYRQVLDPIRVVHGHRTAKGLDEMQARKILEKIGKDRPGMANLTRAVMHKVMKLARVHPNPFAGIPPYRIGTHHTWTEQELTAYEAKWPVGTRQRLAYAALLWTSQRAGDVVRMRRPAPTTTTIDVVQQKTGAEVSIPIHSELWAAIKAGPSNGVFLIGDERGRPISRHSLTRIVKAAAKAAGLPAKCLPHGLRKAAMRRLAEHGATEKEIQGVSGHKTLKEIARYTAAASQKRLAENAMGKLVSKKNGESV
jgi:integrase